MFMAKSNFISEDPATIVQIAKKYMDDIGNELQWNDTDANINFLWESKGGYGYHDENSNEFKEITDYLRGKMFEKSKINRVELFEKFVETMTNEPRGYLKLSESRYFTADIFSDGNPQILWDKLTSLTPSAFNEITHHLTQEIISHHLRNKKSQKQFDFWKNIIDLGEKFLEDHQNDNKAKCFQLRENFLPQLREMVSQYEQQ